MEIKSERQKEKIALMAILLAGSCFMTYYFHVVIETSTVFTHFFYIPIILASLWWKRKGLAVAIFLAVFLIFSHHFIRDYVLTANDYLRALIFVVIGFIVALLSERITKTEGMIRETDEYSENLFNYANAPIIVWNPEGRINRFNHAFEYMTGLTADEVIGQELSILFPEASREESLSKIERTLSGEYWESVEIPILCEDGDIRVALWNSANIYAKDGKTLLATIAQGQDITELKQAEESLRKSEERFRDISYNMADWIWEVDNNGRYTFTSGKINEILGYDPEELIGKTPFELMPEDEAKRIGEVFRRIASEKKPIVDLENWNLTKEGDQVCLLTNGIPVLDDRGELLGYRGVDKDITQQKLAEEKLLKKAKELENFNKLAVDRELKVIELKKEINALLEESGKESRYKIVNADI